MKPIVIALVVGINIFQKSGNIMIFNI